MSNLAPLISDLALILICAGIMTLIFKRLKQPLVLGYIVAGFITSPHFYLTPSVADTSNIKIWSDIGVIFLLFALGLDFSFKKLMKVGGTAIISACTIIFSMILVGMFVGWSFGWQQMDCIYLGGMLAMSSTTIIYKAFDDLGLRQQKFAGLVLSILILEDILAIVLMVMLSTMAVSKNFEGGEMIYSIVKLVFFLVLWFVTGIYMVPLFLKRAGKLMSNETLLIVSLAFCFGMVVLAAKVGFSPAFGAFIMGSILAETLESENIAKLVSPVKDLFGAIFFVSVGMMVDSQMIVEYIVPILALVVAILLGQTIFGTSGVLLAGQPLKTAMQCGFSLTQIGEFAFIIASLGVSLHVTSDFLYPIVVAVSVITTFLTPYMIRLAEPAYTIVNKRIPGKWRYMIDNYSSGVQPVNHHNNWKLLLSAILKLTLVYSVLSFAVVAICLKFMSPFIIVTIGEDWGRIVSVVITIAMTSPFLRALIMKKNHSKEFRTLWIDSRFNHAPLISLILLRIFIAAFFVVYVIDHMYEASAALLAAVTLIVIIAMIFSRFLKKQSIIMERVFVQNLRSKDMRAEYLGVKKPEYAGKLLDRDMHLSDFLIPSDSLWAGKTLKELNLGRKYGVHVASIIRGNYRINIPGGTHQIFPNDTLQVIGTDSQLSAFSEQILKVSQRKNNYDFVEHEMLLRQMVIQRGSPFIGHSIEESGIRKEYHCMVVGVELAGESILHAPNMNIVFLEGDVVWVVGENNHLQTLFNASLPAEIDA